MKILYIEDDLIDQIAFKRLVKAHPKLEYKITDSLDGALQLVKENKFDLILTDFYLPGHTARDIIGHFKSLPLFIVSGLDDDDQIRELYDEGIRGHFKKPLTKENGLQLAQMQFSPMKHIKKKEEIPLVKETVLDFAYLNKIILGAEHLKNELIEIFVNVGTKEYGEIDHWIKEKNWDALCFSFHKLRSNLRMMGYRWLAYKAGEYEKCCNSMTNLELVENETTWFLKELKKGILQAKLFLENSTKKTA